MKKYQTIIESGALMALGIATIIGSLMLDSFGEFVLSPGLFPFMLGILLLILAASMLIRSLKQLKLASVSSESMGDDAVIRTTSSWPRLLKIGAFVAVSLLYVLFMKYTGFVIATVLYVFITTFLLGERRWWMLILLPVISSLVIYFAFDKGLQVYLP